MGKIDKKTTLILLLLVTGGILSLYAQERLLRGKVTDLQSHEAIIGATVSIKGKTIGSVTDLEGTFQLALPEELPTTLEIRYIGYKSEELQIQQGGFIEIELSDSQQNLDEVVVIGYGTQRKKELIGSVAVISAEQLSNRPITNSTQALQGANGVYVNQSSGRPGADGATIRIRGAGTLNSNDPLVLVNGIEFPLADVNPADIESITVLKDAASAAIYGNRAANGVVLVQTKSGSKDRSQIEYSGYVGFQKATFVPDVVTNSVDYMTGKNRALANEGKPAEYSDELIERFRTGTDPYLYSNTNWFDVMYRNALIQEHNLRFSGGNEKTVWSLSLGYLNQEGILLNTQAEKYSVSANIVSEVKPWLKVGGNFTGSFRDSQESAYTSHDGNGEGGIMGLLYRGLPMQVPYAQDGSYADQWVRVPGHNFFRNPLALSYEGFRKNQDYRTLASVFLEVQLPFHVLYKVTGGANILYSKEKYAYPEIWLTHPETGEKALMGNIPTRGVKQIAADGINLTNFHTLNYQETFGGLHAVTALLGFSVETFKNGKFSGYNEGYLGNDLTELNAGSTSPAVTGTSEESRLASWFGRLHYRYKDRYLLESNFRYDGSSRFARNNRWGFFPSFSAGWIISEEAFLTNVHWLDQLKLRGSWGELGNQEIALYSYINSLSLGTNYSFNGAVSGGSAITQLSDPDITWETTRITDIGVDLGFFRNRLTVQADWYSKQTSNILRRVSIPSQVGNLTGPYRNIGSVSNKGFEVSVNYRNQTGDFYYSIGGNIAWLTNKVTDLNSNIYYSGETITQEGYAIDSFYGLLADGIFQSEEEIAAHAYQSDGTQPGDLRYINIDDSDDIIDNNDRVVIGSSIPKYTYGFTLEGNYKGFDLQLFFQGVQGVDTYAQGNLAQPYRNGAGVTQEWLTDSWTPENPGARLPRLTTSRGYPQNFQTSSFWIQDASYLRLKNIQLGYTVPEAFTRQIGLNRVRLFVNGQNLLTFTGFKLGDPERNLTKDSLIEYPIAKTFTGGVNIVF